MELWVSHFNRVFRGLHFPTLQINLVKADIPDLKIQYYASLHLSQPYARGEIRQNVGNERRPTGDLFH